MFEKQFTDLSTDNIESKTGFLSTPELFWGRIRLYLFKGPRSYSCCQSLDLLLLGVECSQGLQEMGFCPGLITLPCSSVLPVMDYIMMLMLNLNWAFTFKSVSLNFLSVFFPSPARKVDLTNERSKVNRLRGCGHGSDGKIPSHRLIACGLILEAYVLERELASKNCVLFALHICGVRHAPPHIQIIVLEKVIGFVTVDWCRSYFC